MSTSRRGSARSALVAAGHQLFAQFPVDAVSIDDIVDAAGVAKGSFYNHFQEKVDLLQSVRDEIRADIVRQVHECNCDVEDAALRVARALSVYFRIVVDNPRYIAIALQSAPDGGNSITDRLNRGAFEDARKGMCSGRFSIPSAESAAAFVVGAGYAALVNMLSDQRIESVASAGRHTILMVLRGLGVSEDEAATISAIAIEEIVTREISA